MAAETETDPALQDAAWDLSPQLVGEILSFGDGIAYGVKVR
jgi:hypothetical protein